mmetsp:Transcript_13704/g.29760  ORF Transcript_13704/g.29760 Transcript_13704/m.29760 type:complete len:207 (-) Transcript_13704:30-650(-)
MVLNWSRCVNTPITFGKPCVCIMFRNSNDSISNPNLASTQRRTRSATLAASSMAVGVFGHSISVIRRVLEVHTVMGPVGSDRLWFVYSLTRLLISVDFPTPGGPTTATRGGGPSSTRADRRSVLPAGTYSFFWARSRFRWMVRWVRTTLETEKARGLWFRPWRLPSLLSFLRCLASRPPRPDLFALWERLSCRSASLGVGGAMAMV